MGHLSLAQKWYQAGLSKEKAVERGACPAEFDKLENLYGGASLPPDVLYNRASMPAYSGIYHTGGQMGLQLRAIAKECCK